MGITVAEELLSRRFVQWDFSQAVLELVLPAIALLVKRVSTAEIPLQVSSAQQVPTVP